MDDPYDNPLIQERLRKLKEIREKGINPYPYTFAKTHNAQDILHKHKNLKPEEHTDDAVQIAGRLMQLRNMGKAAFAHLQDESGKIQLYLRKDDMDAENFKLLKKVDLGDFIGVYGTVFATKTGEITIQVARFELLTKSIRPLPEKYHGIQDKELRYRHRYLDLIMNPDVREVFKKRSIMERSIRRFCEDRRFLEVTTPALQTIYGGAEARPFVTHINAWDMTMYLRISPELHLKRLLVGGFEKVYTLCQNFRNEGVDRSHNPEFTMMEVYQAYADYNDMMTFLEELYEHVAQEVNGTTKVKHGDVELDFKAPWPRLTMKEALIKFADIDIDKLSDDEIKQQLSAYAITLEGDYDPQTAMILLFEELVEDKLVQPIHIIDHPNNNPLCKVHREDGSLCERFESYCLGMEISNAYSELNDPLVQREVLSAQADALRAGFDESHPMDEDFVRAIETGMPPAGGLGIGIDRMAILLLGQESIRDVILFPTMKPEQKTVEEQKKERMEPFKESLE